MCQNSPFYEVTLATDSCSEGDFLFIRVLTQPRQKLASCHFVEFTVGGFRQLDKLAFGKRHSFG